MRKLLPTLIALLSIHFAVSQTVQFELKVFLEGPFSTGQMTTDLNSSGFLPLTQPYGSQPWNYEGVETVSAIPNVDIVDWVLIDLVFVTFSGDTAILHLFSRKACFILKTGLVKDLDGVSLPTFQHDGQTPLYVRVHHRNHLNIISSSALTEDLGLFSWDFTTGSEKALGGEQTQNQVGTGIWGMISSDGNAGGQIDNLDKNEVWLPELGLSGYLFGDYNMNGQVDMDDKLTQWMLNVGRGSYPVRDSIVVPPFTCGDAITDIDGNIYNTVLIADQCWMKENLKTTTYKNGTPVPNVTDNSNWSNLTTGAYVWYNNDIDWKDKYGALYNWYATVDSNGLCPEGWIVPSIFDFSTLTDLIGGTHHPLGNKLKSCRTINSPYGEGCNTSEHPRWDQHSNYGTDDYGFSALPAGVRASSGPFQNIGSYGFWWFSTESSSINSQRLFLRYDYGAVMLASYNKRNGISVRCLKGSAPSAAFNVEPTTGLVPLPVSFTDQSKNSPTTWYWDFGDGNFSTEQNPTHIYQDTGTYTVQLTLTNSYGSDMLIKTDLITVNSTGGIGPPCPGIPTITDIDGNVYNTVLIGDQCWMKENLKTTRYRNGIEIELVEDNEAWQYNTTGAYTWYANNEAWENIYGALYNWYAVNNPNGLCPEGWHVPDKDEWAILFNVIGGTASPNGNKLKSCRQVNSPYGGDCNTSDHPRWNQSNMHYGTDDFGFSGLPGSFRSLDGSWWLPLGSQGGWWTSSQIDYGTAWQIVLLSNWGFVSIDYESKNDGQSVRCIKDIVVNSPPYLPSNPSRR